MADAAKKQENNKELEAAEAEINATKAENAAKNLQSEA